MVRTLADARFAVLATVLTFLVACGGSDTIDDDSGASAGAAGIGGSAGSDAASGGTSGNTVADGSSGSGGMVADGSLGDVGLLDQSLGDVSLPDVSLGDVALGSDSLPDTISLDVKVDVPDVGVDVDAGVNVDAATDAAVSLDADASVDVNADVDAGASTDARPDVSTEGGSVSYLGSVAQTFAVLGGQTVTNSGVTIIQGNLGISPLSTLGGTQPTVVGSIHLNDLTAQQAQGELTTAYNTLAGQVCGTALTGQDLGGLTLTPGVYCFTGGAHLSGTLFLDGQGSSTGVWIFQIASTLITANNAHIQMINSGDPCNVYWQVGSSATIADQTTFSGNVLALADITLQTGSVVLGRLMSRAAGSVTLANSTISITTCSGAPTLDAGAPDADANLPDVDAGAPDVDAGVPDADAGAQDAEAGQGN